MVDKEAVKEKAEKERKRKEKIKRRWKSRKKKKAGNETAKKREEMGMKTGNPWKAWSKNGHQNAMKTAVLHQQKTMGFPKQWNTC